MTIKKESIEMKKILLFLILVICAVPALAIEEVLTASYLNQTSSFTMDSPKLNLIKLKYEPYPVEPGDYFTLWLEVENIGGNTVENAGVEFVDTYPFTLLDKEYVKTIGRLAKRQQAVVKFEKIRVDKDAIDGDHTLKIKLNMGGAYIGITKSLDIKVESVTPLFLVLIDSKPERIRPGSVAKVNVGLKNLADSVMEDILVRIDLTSKDAPFVPIGSTTEQKIEMLYPGKSSTLTFDLMALPDADPGAYKIPLNLTYHDKAGNQYTKHDLFGLLIGDGVEYNVVLEDSEIYQRNRAGTISLNIYNIGPTDMKFLTTELVESDDYKIISNPIIYLGNVDPDDYESAEYKIYVDGCKIKCKDEITLKLKLSYKDTYNEEHSGAEEIPLKLYSGKEVALYGLITNQKSSSPALLYLIIIIFIYLTFKNWRKEKDLWAAIKATLRSFLAFVVRIIRSLRWRSIRRIPRKIRIFLMQLR